VNQRLVRFQRSLADHGLAGAVVRHPANVTYLTGYPAGPSRASFAVVSDRRMVLVVPGNGAAARGLADGELEVVGYSVPGSTTDRVVDPEREAAVALGAAVDAAGLRGHEIGVEEARLSALHAAVVAERGRVRDLGDLVEGMRRIKDDGELALIRAAVGCNDRGFAAGAAAIQAGVSELAVQAAVVRAIQEQAGVPVDVLESNNAFISGPRTLLAAAPATPRRLEQGDLMILDLNPVIRAYKGDTTRTFCVGEPTAAQRRVHDALVRGLEAAEALARPGVRAGDVAAALVAPIVAAGYGTLPAHGGHGIGLEHLERPYIIPGDPMPLKAGMVITLEPGVYLPEIGGLRIEDDYLVTETGLAVLSHYPRELVVCG
jgi:Xaa-Pro aminopeptidase